MEVQGQVLPTSERGQIIKKTIEEYKPISIVEIGTWKGMGSTLTILNSMSDDSKFLSLETNKDFYEIAKLNLKNYLNRVLLIYGKIIDVEEVFEYIKDLNITSEQKIWLENDIKNFKDSPNVLDVIPNKIDFLLLDGGEFSTYKEWLKLKDRSKIIALDDINVLKCERIFFELKNNPNYTLIHHTNEGHGFCVFIKN